MVAVTLSRLRLDNHVIDIPSFQFHGWCCTALYFDGVARSDLPGFARQQREIVVLPEDGQDFGILWYLAADATTRPSIYLQMDIEGEHGGRVVERDGRRPLLTVVVRFRGRFDVDLWKQIQRRVIGIVLGRCPG